MNVHDKYREYIKGKRVVFVGACPNLIGKETGKDIDNFDIIVRSNGSFEIQEKYKQDYGSRTDVLYCNVQYAREMHPLPVVRYVQNGIDFLCCKTLSHDKEEKYNKIIPTRTIKHVIQRVHKQVSGALMGVFIIEDILECKPKELHLTGIDFFESKKKVFEHDNYQEYLDGYLPPKIREQGNVINKGKKEDGHNQYTNTLYIYKLWEKGLVTMPDFIQDIMKGIINEKNK